MDALLGKITQHAVNYAIRSGIGITASYAIKQTSRLLKTVDDNADYRELRNLQERLDSKIRIISPAIDMIELISARGNTTLESAVALTKALRWQIQSLGNRLAKAASEEELSRRGNARRKPTAGHEAEIRAIVLDMRQLLTRIEDAVPLINLAITTSGASLSTTLPATVSPSRLLQASTFVTAGDSQYSQDSSNPVQVGPAFVLSLYMLFAGHAHRLNEDSESMRGTTWKEVIHKARVRLLRAPLHAPGRAQSASQEHLVPAEGRANEFAYQLEIIEDFDDDRVHSFEDDEPQPGPYRGVQLAGIREILPIQQVSKIFYADTGKILGIGSQGETNNPVLLLKRDVNAVPPRRMMQNNEQSVELYADPEDAEGSDEGKDDSQNDIDQQLRRESLLPVPKDEASGEYEAGQEEVWRLPHDLDPEWFALEVYTEEEDSSSEEEQDVNNDSAYASHRPSSSGEVPTEESLAVDLAHLRLNPPSSPSPSPSSAATQDTARTPQHLFSPAKPLRFGPIRSSLSLLEMLIRLTALQQFQQASHLSIPDELLTFFLEESSTTGAGGDVDERRRTRREARRKVGFDPYDESPVKRRGEDYQYQAQVEAEGRQSYAGSVGGYSRGGTPYLADRDERDRFPSSRWSRERSLTPQGTPATPEPWLLRSVEAPSSSSHRDSAGVLPSSPIASYRPGARKSVRPTTRVQREGQSMKGSPLGRGMSAETDSTLGTSPGSPTLVSERAQRGPNLRTDDAHDDDENVGVDRSRSTRTLDRHVEECK